MIDKIALIYLKDRKVLSTRTKGKDTWYLPGGKREGAETDLETLVREIQEELTVVVRPETVRFYGVFEAQAHGKAEGQIVRMTCYTADFEGEPVPGNEIEEMGWFTADDAVRSSQVDQLIFADLKGKNLLL